MAKQESTLDDVAKLATPIPLSEDVLKMAREARKDQGIHEQEVSFTGEAGLQDSLICCEKNPGHEGFTPITELCTERLPEVIRYPDVADFLIYKAQETVRISCSYTSTERPENYCFSNYRGRNDLTRYGSGRVWSVHLEQVRNDIPCPFADCMEQRGTEWDAENVGNRVGNEELEHVLHEKAKGEYSKEEFGKSTEKNPEACPETIKRKEETITEVNVDTRPMSEQIANLAQSDQIGGKSCSESNLNNLTKEGVVGNKFEERHEKISLFKDLKEKCGKFKDSEDQQSPKDDAKNISKICDGCVSIYDSRSTCENDCKDKCNGALMNSYKTGEMEKDNLISNIIQTEVCKERVSCAKLLAVVKTEEDLVLCMRGKMDPDERTMINTQSEFDVAENKDSDKQTPNNYFETGSERTLISETPHQLAPPQHHVSGYFRIHTAKHVIFNDEEARQTIVEFFYDDHRDVRRVMRARGVRVARSDLEGDYCVLDCVTHDRNLGPALDRVRRQWMGFWPQVKGKLYGTDLSMVVSHPHGCSKQFSLGRCLGREWGEVPGGQGWYRYTYDAATCPGSSGAPVWVPGRDGLFSGYAPHSGSFNPDVARSAVWFFWNQQNKQ